MTLVSTIDGGGITAAARLAESSTRDRASVDGAVVESLHAAVSRGMGWLDEHLPGWHEKVDADALDLNSPCHCILGQAEGDFYEAMTKAGHGYIGEGGGHIVDFDWAADHGFTLGEVNAFRVSCWDLLTDIWRERLTLREAMSMVEASVTTVDTALLEDACCRGL